MKRLIVGTQSTEDKEYIECMAFIDEFDIVGKGTFSVYVKPDSNRKYTNFKMCCYYWNREMRIFRGIKWQYKELECPTELDVYMQGQFDDKACAQHPSYIPSTLEMPNYRNLPVLK